MRKNRNKAAGPGRAFIPYIATALAVTASYILFSLLLGAGEDTVRRLMLAGVALCFLLFFVRNKFRIRDLDAGHLIIAIIAAGIVMRTGYMLYTSILQRGHDIGAWDTQGHYGYMYQIFMTGRLPATNAYQFYHPPFQHIAQAAVVRVFSLFQPDATVDTLFQSAKLVPCFASCALLFVCRSICDEMGLSRRASAAVLAVIAFHPTFFILSASVNNDALMLFFFMTAVLYTIRWYKRPTMKHIVLVAVSIGLSMMTKISGGMVALFTGPVFLAMLIRRLRKKDIWPLVGQFAVFLLICLPLALWYPVRNSILFHQPLGYVIELSHDSKLYCGGRTIVERFLSFPLSQIADPLYCRPMEDCNLWMYTLKCSVFGEFAFDQAPVFGIGLILTNLAMILISLAAMVYVMVRGKRVDPFARQGLFLLWLVQMVSFIAFNLRYPFGCTMDYRYIMPTAIVGAAYLGIALDRLYDSKKAICHGLYYAGCVVAGLFCIASILFYAA